jgi:hypothetical protein
MTMPYDHDDDYLDEDAAEAFRGFKPKRRFARQRGGDDDAMTPGNPNFNPDARADDIVFPGAIMGPEYVRGHVGFGAQIYRVTEAYQLFDVDSRGRWTNKVDEVAKEPPGTKYDKVRKGKFDPDGHSVSKVVYLDFLRRDDPTVWTLRLQGGELRTYDDWLSRALSLRTVENKAVPWWGARWRWHLIKEEGEDRRGNSVEYTNWAFELLGKYRDDSAEAPSEEEYLCARALFRGETPPRTPKPNTSPTAPFNGDTPPPASEDDCGGGEWAH